MNEDKKITTGLETRVVDKAAVAPVETSDAETPTMKAIRKWVSRRVHSSPLSRNTEAYNYLMKQLPELASMIDEENKA